MGKGAPVFEFLSSPFGLVAVGLGVLAVAVLALCLWITTLDRRMRGMADGLETERRKVAELQMVIGRRANAARSYGNRGRAAAPAPAPAPVAAAAPAAPAGTAVPPRGAGAPVPMGASRRRGRAPAGRPCRLPRAPLRARCPEDVGRAPPRLAAGGRPAAFRCRRSRRWTPGCRAAPAVQQPIVVPDRKMSRKARREAERAFAARAAAELEARQARRAQEAAAAQRSFGVGAGPRGSRSCAPRRSRPSCCGRSRPGPGLRPGAARLRRAFRRPRPPRALGAFPPRASGVSRCAMSLPA